MLIGGVGWMAGPACIVPRQSVRFTICAAPENGRRRWRCSASYGASTKPSRASISPPASRPGLQIQGYDVGDPVPPQAALTQMSARWSKTFWPTWLSLETPDLRRERPAQPNVNDSLLTGRDGLIVARIPAAAGAEEPVALVSAEQRPPSPSSRRDRARQGDARRTQRQPAGATRRRQGLSGPRRQRAARARLAGAAGALDGQRSNSASMSMPGPGC